MNLMGVTLRRRALHGLLMLTLNLGISVRNLTHQNHGAVRLDDIGFT